MPGQTIPPLATDDIGALKSAYDGTVADRATMERRRNERHHERDQGEGKLALQRHLVLHHGVAAVLQLVADVLENLLLFGRDRAESGAARCATFASAPLCASRPTGSCC